MYERGSRYEMKENKKERTKRVRTTETTARRLQRFEREDSPSRKWSCWIYGKSRCELEKRFDGERGGESC